MPSKSRAKRGIQRPRWPFVLFFVLGLVAGFVISALSEPLTPDLCARRIQQIGGPAVAVEFVCYGKSF